MAGRPDYRAGTVTLTNGSKAFTTSGAALQTAGITRGDMIWANGLFLIIDEVTGQNSGTLADACPAGAAGTRPLVVRYQADGSRLSAFVTQLTAELQSGNVESLASLIGAANQIPYFSGPGAMTLTALTPFARSLLDDVSAAGAVATLSSAFGWGASNTNVNVPGDNLDALRTNGVFRATATTIGVPSSVGVWQVIHAGQGANYAVQLAFQITTAVAVPNVMTRVLNNNVWSSWRSLTGERGTNANGDYVRFADGTQICWLYEDKTSEAWTTARGSVFCPSSNFITWNYPAAFTGMSVATGTVRRGATDAMPSGIHVYTPGASQCNYLPYTSKSLASGDSKFVCLMAVGRWF